MKLQLLARDVTVHVVPRVHQVAWVVQEREDPKVHKVPMALKVHPVTVATLDQMEMRADWSHMGQRARRDNAEHREHQVNKNQRLEK